MSEAFAGERAYLRPLPLTPFDSVLGLTLDMGALKFTQQMTQGTTRLLLKCKQARFLGICTGPAMPAQHEDRSHTALFRLNAELRR